MTTCRFCVMSANVLLWRHQAMSAGAMRRQPQRLAGAEELATVVVLRSNRWASLLPPQFRS
jgi:hypothetical protein